MTAQRTPFFLALLLCFFLSGAAGLVYQVAWTRQLSLVFGSTEEALVAVLAVFLGSLGIGAMLGGRFSNRLRSPLRAYALLELAIAVSALAVPWAVERAERLYVLTFGSQDALPAAGGWEAVLFQLGATFATIAPPTICMGATLPFLARYAVRTERQIGSATGLLYAVNTVGAVLGAPLTGFVLLPELGLRQTALVAVGLNLAAAALAWVLARRSAVEPRWSDDATATPIEPYTLPRVGHVLAILVIVSGAVSLLYEVLWTRLLSHPLGGSIYSFSTMLASFLAGIALGSALASRLADSAERSAIGWIVAQLGIAGFTAASYLLLSLLPLETTFAGGSGQSPWSGPLLGGMALLPGALCIGATFPFAVRVLACRAEEAAPAAARIYGWSTLGSVIGAILTGLFLLPAGGFAGTLAVGLAANLVLAGAAALSLGRRSLALATLSAIALVALAVFPPPTPWRILRSGPLANTPIHGRVVHYAVGRSATVLLAESEGRFRLTTNGLPEGTISPPGLPKGRYVVTGWLGSMAVLARPEARSMLVVGLGAGELLEAVPETVESIEVVEIEPEVERANRKVGSSRLRDPLSDPRLRVLINDARGALLLSGKRFDAIVSQPSHPWTSGSAHLYTRELFELARDHLASGGVFVQWIGLAFVDEPLLRSVLATLVEVFPHVRVYRPPTGAALVFVASQKPFDMSTTVPRALASGAILPDVGIARTEDVTAALVLDEPGARRLGAGSPAITDDRNLLEARSPRVIGMALGRDRGDSVLAAADPLIGGATPDLDRAYVVRRLLATGSATRARRVAEATLDPAARQTGLAQLAAASGRRELARSLLGDSLSRDSGSAETRALALLLGRTRIARGGPPDARLLPLDQVERAVVEGWRSASTDSWTEVRTLELELANARPGEPLFAAATRLRAAWRIAASDPLSAREALSLIDRLLARSRLPEDLLLRARAAIAARDPRSTLATLSDLADRIVRHPQRAAFARRGHELLSTVPSDESNAEWRESVRGRLAGIEP